MKTLNIIGISIYLIIAIVLAIRRFNLIKNLHNQKIKEEDYERLARRNTIELIAVVILAMLYVYTPFKIFIF